MKLLGYDKLPQAVFASIQVGYENSLHEPSSFLYVSLTNSCNQFEQAKNVFKFFAKITTRKIGQLA